MDDISSRIDKLGDLTTVTRCKLKKKTDDDERGFVTDILLDIQFGTKVVLNNMSHSCSLNRAP